MGANKDRLRRHWVFARTGMSLTMGALTLAAMHRRSGRPGMARHAVAAAAAIRTAHRGNYTWPGPGLALTSMTS